MKPRDIRNVKHALRVLRHAVHCLSSRMQSIGAARNFPPGGGVAEVTLWSRDTGKLIVCQLVGKYPAFYGTHIYAAAEA